MAAPNMPHCQFRNTLAALHQCLDTMSDEAFANVYFRLSDDEREACRYLIALCRQIGEDFSVPRKSESGNV